MKKKAAPTSMRRRFEVELLVIHPTLTPRQIEIGIGLRAKSKHCVGEPRKTPKGRTLSGLHPDTRWRYGRVYRTKNQWFADKVGALLDRLETRKSFLKAMRRTGGSACLIVQLLDGSYFGDELPARTLARMSALGLGFGLESYLGLPD